MFIPMAMAAAVLFQVLKRSHDQAAPQGVPPHPPGEADDEAFNEATTLTQVAGADGGDGG